MEKTRQIFETQQAQVLVCGSGRVMVALNEEQVKTTEQVPVAMDEDGTMEYETREKTKYAYDCIGSPSHPLPLMMLPQCSKQPRHRCLLTSQPTTPLQP